MRSGLRVLAATAAAAGVALAWSGCGDATDEPATGAERVEIDAAAEPVEAFVKRFARLNATAERRRDCAELEAIYARSYIRFPCPAGPRLAASMRSFRVIAAEAHGTGGVVDYKSGQVPDGAAIVLFVAPDRNWAISKFGVVTDPSVGTDDAESADGYRAAAADYLTAVRERDCSAFREVALDEGLSCDQITAGARALAARLDANRTARLRYAGGNGTYGFFNLETRRPAPANLTISVVRGKDGSYTVLDAASSPTAADIREVVREYKRQGTETTDESTGRKVD